MSRLLIHLLPPLTLLGALLAPPTTAASTSVVISAVIDEELPPGSPVVSLLDAMRRDGHLLAPDAIPDFRQFNADPPGCERYFRVEPATGHVTVQHRVDRDRLCTEVSACCSSAGADDSPCRLTLQVQSDREFSHIVTLAVQIVDLNDNAPRWSSVELTREFSEAAQPGEFRSLPLAEDADSPRLSVQRYALLPPAPAEFGLEFRPGAAATGADPASAPSLRLTLKLPLDREAKDSYEFGLAAFDGGSPPRNGTVRLRILVADENDEVPTFDKPTYEADIREDAPMGREVLQVRAVDKDVGQNGRVTYSISAFEAARVRSLFVMDPSSGSLRVAAPLDFEQSREHRFTVVAQDQNRMAPRQSTAQVIVTVIDVNDEPPRIGLSSRPAGGGPFQIVENEKPRTVTIVTVRDADSGDNGKVSCGLSGSHKDLFKLVQLPLRESGATLYRLMTARPLDRETDGPAGRSLSLRLSCSDSGQPANTAVETVNLEIVDLNDNPPAFPTSVFYFTINEATRQGQVAFSVAAEDPDAGDNARLGYAINATGPGAEAAVDVFKIGSDGRATLTRRLDRETVPRYAFDVVAFDHGEPSLSATASVVVMVEDDNDNAPAVAPFFAFLVAENASIGHHVGQLNATDPDEGENARVVFRMSPSASAPSSPFHVSTQGLIVLISPLDREHTSRYEFAVLAQDSSPTAPRTSTATVVIDVEDVNDCAPRFLFPSPGNRTLRISAKTSVATMVVRLVAKDADSGANGRVAYFIRRPLAGPFHVDVETGELTLVRPVAAEDLAAGGLNLTVVARDSGYPAMETEQTLTVLFSASTADRIGGAGGPGGGGSGGRVSESSSDSLLVVAGLVAVTAAFVLVLLLGIILLTCRQRCAAVLMAARDPRPQRREAVSASAGGQQRRSGGSGRGVKFAPASQMSGGGGGFLSDSPVEEVKPMASCISSTVQQFRGGAAQGYMSYQQDGLAPADLSSLQSLEGSNDDSGKGTGSLADQGGTSGSDQGPAGYQALALTRATGAPGRCPRHGAAGGGSGGGGRGNAYEPLLQGACGCCGAPRPVQQRLSSDLASSAASAGDGGGGLHYTTIQHLLLPPRNSAAAADAGEDEEDSEDRLARALGASYV